MGIVAAERSRRSYSWRNTGRRLGLSDPRSLKKTLHGAGLRLLRRGTGWLVLMCLKGPWWGSWHKKLDTCLNCSCWGVDLLTGMQTRRARKQAECVPSPRSRPPAALWFCYWQKLTGSQLAEHVQNSSLSPITTPSLEEWTWSWETIA